MDPLKVSLDSGTLSAEPIPTMYQPPYDVLWNEQPRGADYFWHLYAVYALGIRLHSLHQPLF